MSFTMDCDQDGCGWGRGESCDGRCAYGSGLEDLRPCITEWGYYDVGMRKVAEGCSLRRDCFFRLCRRDCVAYDLLGSDTAFCDRYRNDNSAYNNCINTKTRCEHMYKNDPKNDQYNQIIYNELNKDEIRSQLNVIKDIILDNGGSWQKQWQNHPLKDDWIRNVIEWHWHYPAKWLVQEEADTIVYFCNGVQTKLDHSKVSEETRRKVFKWCIENYNNIENQRDPAYTRINLFLTHEANRGLFDSEMVEFCNKLSNTKLPICSCSEAGLTYNLGDDSTTEYIKTIPHCFLSKCTQSGYRSYIQSKTQCPDNVSICNAVANISNVSDSSSIKDIKQTCPDSQLNTIASKSSSQQTSQPTQQTSQPPQQTSQPPQQTSQSAQQTSKLITPQDQNTMKSTHSSQNSYLITILVIFFVIIIVGGIIVVAIIIIRRKNI